MTEAQLRVLVTVADTGGFSPAAARLSMSQPGVSRAVAALEAELGAPLLVRRNGRAAPTPAGERVLLHAREVLARAEAIRQEAAASGGRCAGRVRLGSFASVSAQLLPRILAALRVRHPGVEVALFEGHDEEVLRWVRERAVDVGVVSRAAPDLDVRPLASDDLVAVLPAGHPARRARRGDARAARRRAVRPLPRRLRAAHPRDVHAPPGTHRRSRSRCRRSRRSSPWSRRASA